MVLGSDERSVKVQDWAEDGLTEVVLFGQPPMSETLC